MSQELYKNPAISHMVRYTLTITLTLLEGGNSTAQKNIDNYVFFNLDRNRIQEKSFLETEKLVGAQLKYTWKELEPTKNNYDFQAIKKDLDYLTSHGKKLFIQLQDVTFDTARVFVPRYLTGPVSNTMEELISNTMGAKMMTISAKTGMWQEDGIYKVAERFHKLLLALGKETDGKITGINLPETAVGFGETGKLYPEGFTPQIYRRAILKQMEVAKQAFAKSVVIQYANFMPGEWLPWENKGYLESLYQFAAKNDIGMGGPDIKIYKRAQMNHSYRFLKEFSNDIKTGIAVQWSNYQEINPKTKKEVTIDEIYEFGKNEIGLNYIFWCTQEPYYTNRLIP